MPASTRVLVVDDNPDHSQLTLDYLEVVGGFEVTAAADLGELWERLAGDVYDIILLDYNLPDGNGLEALEAIPCRGYALPVVMVSGRGDERVAAQAIQRGAADYLVKTGDYLSLLPALIAKVVHTHSLRLSNQYALEKVRYQALLLDNIDDAVVVWDLNYQITFWNRAAERLFGWSAAERLGQSAAHCYLAAFVPAIELSPAAAGEDSLERRGKRRGGDVIWLSSRVSALHDSNGRQIGCMDVSRDITARKQLEAQMTAAQLQLAQASRLAAVGALATSVAHEISNPLATVIGEAQLLRAALTDPAPAESAAAIEAAGWRVQAAVQRLLEQGQPAEVHMAPVALNATIERALTSLSAYIETDLVRVVPCLDPALPPVVGDAQLLEDLWRTLMLLARAGADDDRPHRLSITSACDAGGAAVVSLNDDNRLLPPRQIDTFWEPSVGPAAQVGGTSLELSICQEIVQRHGGTISVASAPETGTTMTVRFYPND